MDPSLLHLVKRPSRYVGCERNSVRISAEANPLRVGLAFPDLYEIGMSHLGMAILYDCLNRTPGLASERVFLPGPDLQQLLRERGVTLATLESATPLDRLDVLGFTLAYELTYTNVLAILDLGNIPLRAETRTREHPVVLAGGPCAFNPEPMSAFIDAFIIGEAEFRLPEVCRVIAAWKDGGGARKDLLRDLDRLEGVYVPSRYAWRRDEEGGPFRLFPLGDRTTPVRKCTVPDLDAAPYPDRPVVPFTRIVHDRVSIEAARGCRHACRFCQASVLYRPYRERSPARIRDLALAGLESTGHGDLSLLALSVGDHSCLDRVTACLMQETAARRVALSLPSLRVGSLSPSVVEQILRVRKTGFTLAPEAATERLRRVINKDIEESELFHTVRFLAARGWRSLKLYFMIGLPTEEDRDVEAIARLSEALQKEGRSARRGPFQLTVNVSTFVPKAHTPFQWEPQLGVEATRRKQAFLKKRLHKPGIQLKLHDPRLSVLEGLFARGDRTLGDLLETAYRRGCVLDGWTEHLRFDLWQASFGEASVSPESGLQPYPEPGHPLPWEWIDPGVASIFLAGERLRAHRGEETPFSCLGDCGRCGVCASGPRASVRPAAEPPAPPGRQAADAGASPDGPPDRAARSARAAASPPRQRFRIAYAKTGPCALLSHLETINVFYRAVRRSGLPACYTEGEHPQPRLSFSPALPVGVESLSEHMDLWVGRPVDRERLRERLDAELPDGFAVLSVKEIPMAGPSVEESILWVDYEIGLRPGSALPPGWADPAAAVERLRAGASSPAPTPAAPPSAPPVHLEPLENGRGLRCRIHKAFGSLLSPSRVLDALMQDARNPHEVLVVRKTHTAFLAYLPAVVQPGRRRPLSGRQGAGNKE